jgi:chromosome segregation ATPase
MGLARENESLKRQLEQLADARNREIMDLQHHFEEQLRELERLKGVDKGPEISAFKDRISQLEPGLTKQTRENAALKQQVTRLQSELKERDQTNQSLTVALDRARIDVLKATERRPEVNYEDLLAPLEEQLESLTTVITQKQDEINRLKKLVHKECEERIRLQAMLGMAAKPPG